MSQEEYTYDDVYLLIEEKKFQQALDLLLDEEGNLLKKHQDDRVNAWFHVGDVFRELGKYEQAITAYRYSIEDYSRDPVVWLDMGDCYFSLDFFSEAVRCYKAAIDIGEVNDLAHEKLIHVFLRTGEFEKALVYLKQIGLSNSDLKNHLEYIEAKIKLIHDLDNKNIKIERNLEL